MSAIPQSPAEYPTSWLEEKLGASRGSLRGFTYKPVGTGQVADSYRLTLNWAEAGAGPASIIVKCPSPDPTSRDTAVSGELYAREIFWYRTLAPQTDVRRPQCYASEISEDGADFALLLEDCAPAVQGDQLKGAGPGALTLVLHEAARLHAPFLRDPRIKSYPRLSYDKNNRTTRSEYFKLFWAEFKTRYATRLDKAILAMGDYFNRKIEVYLFRDPENFTVTHNDMRVDNILFDGLGGRPVLLDWQTLGIGHPMADVSYLIGTSIANPATRRREEKQLIDAYQKALVSLGAQFDADDFWREYRIYALAGFFMAVISSMLVKRTERGDEMFAVMAERPAIQALELDSLSLL